MNVNIDTMLYITDTHTIGLYTSTDNFEKAVDERHLVDMVEEYCVLFELPCTQHVISRDCYDLVVGLRVELLKALEMVDLYVNATNIDTLKYSGEEQ